MNTECFSQFFLLRIRSYIGTVLENKSPEIGDPSLNKSCSPFSSNRNTIISVRNLVTKNVSLWTLTKRQTYCQRKVGKNLIIHFPLQITTADIIRVLCYLLGKINPSKLRNMIWSPWMVRNFLPFAHLTKKSNSRKHAPMYIVWKSAYLT